jgi:hypothetical protein
MVAGDMVLSVKEKDDVMYLTSFTMDLCKLTAGYTIRTLN